MGGGGEGTLSGVSAGEATSSLSEGSSGSSSHDSAMGAFFFFLVGVFQVGFCERERCARLSASSEEG